MNVPFKVNRGGVIDLNALSWQEIKQTNRNDNPNYFGVNKHATPLYVPVEWKFDGFSTKIGVVVERDVLGGNYKIDFFDHTPLHWQQDLWLVKAVDCATIGSSTPNYDPTIGMWLRWDWTARRWIDTHVRVREREDAKYVSHLRTLGVFAEQPYPQRPWS